jgi:hypothetical protein
MQVHVDLRQQWDDLSVDRLMDMFVVSKMTGMEKPLPVEFEEFPLDSDQQLGANTSNQLPDYLEEWTAPTSTTGKVREGRALESVIPSGACLLLLLLLFQFIFCSRCCTWIVYFECLH